MTICRLMIQDFMYGTGRYPDCFNGARAYDDDNLREGIMFAQGEKELGLTHEPFYRYDLNEFIAWANQKLREGNMIKEITILPKEGGKDQSFSNDAFGWEVYLNGERAESIEIALLAATLTDVMCDLFGLLPNSDVADFLNSIARDA